jgi:putative RNA 2'-phosphotransferase
MNEKNIKRISKFLSLVLRHRPEYINLQLNENGWANVNELIEKAKTRKVNFSIAELNEIVVTNDKQRFAFNDDNSMIRANQGHSVKTIDLQLEAIQPPKFLYHGTVTKFMDSIKNTGLQKRSRQHVHLSEDKDTATKVGSRRGVPIILSVRTLEMHDKGYKFYRSENNVWLTEHVPSEFIEFK